MSPLGKPTRFTKHPSRGFQDILKRRLLRSVLTLRNVAVSKYLQDLATIDALRDIDYPSRAYLVRHLRILCITHTRSLTMI